MLIALPLKGLNPARHVGLSRKVMARCIGFALFAPSFESSVDKTTKEKGKDRCQTDVCNKVRDLDVETVGSEEILERKGSKRLSLLPAQPRI